MMYLSRLECALMLKLILRIILDILLVLGTLVLTFVGLFAFARLLAIFHIPVDNPLVIGLFMVLFYILIMTPYWIWHFFGKDSKKKEKIELPAARKSAIILTIVAIIAVFAIDLFVHHQTFVATVISLAGAFLVPVIYLFKTRDRRSP